MGTTPNPFYNGTGGLLGTGQTPRLGDPGFTGGYSGVGQILPYQGNDANLDMNMWGPQIQGTQALYNTSSPTSGPVSVADAVSRNSSGNVPTGRDYSDPNAFNVPLTSAPSGTPFSIPVSETGSTGYVSLGGRDVIRTADGRLMKNGVYITNPDGSYINDGRVINAAQFNGFDSGTKGGATVGSNFTPISALNPNMASGSLTGNPVFDKETMNNISTLVPGGTSGTTFGSSGASPVRVDTGGVYRDAPATGGSPTVGIPSPITQFGYNTQNGGAAGTTPNASGAVPGAVAAAMPNVVTPELTQALDKTYGEGFGTALTNLLAQGAGYNQGVVNSFLTDIQPYFNDNLNQIMESFAASGQRFSSTAALAAGKFGADFTSHQQALMAQMYQWAYENYLGTLTKFANKNTSGNAFGTISDVLGLVSTGADALNSIGGVSNGGLQKVIDILGAL